MGNNEAHPWRGGHPWRGAFVSVKSRLPLSHCLDYLSRDQGVIVREFPSSSTGESFVTMVINHMTENGKTAMAHGVRSTAKREKYNQTKKFKKKQRCKEEKVKRRKLTSGEMGRKKLSIWTSNRFTSNSGNTARRLGRRERMSRTFHINLLFDSGLFIT